MHNMKKFKKTKSIEKYENKEKKKFFSKELTWALIIVFIMTASTLGYMWSGSDEFTEYEYNGVGFVTTGNNWIAKINKNEVKFDYHPLDVADINISNEIIDKINNTRMIYLTFDPDDPYLSVISKARLDLNDIMWTNFQIYAEGGIMKNVSEYALPVITCKNATAFIPVLYFKEGNETSVIEENNCIFFKAESENDILRLKDRMLYALFGIINKSG